MSCAEEPHVCWERTLSYNHRALPGNDPGLSRRAFIAGVTGLATTSLAGGAPQLPTSSGGPRVIDVHHHIFPPAFVEAARSILSTPVSRARLVSEWTPQRALSQMDQHGIAVAVVSITDPGIWFGDVAATRRVARSCNEYAAQLVRDHPTRFGFFATLPLPDIDGSLSEIAYVFDVLKADGVGLMTNYSNKWPGDTTLSPVFEELNRRNAVVHFHPTTASCCQSVVAGVPDVVLEFPHDTTRAVVSLLYSGALARFRNIRFILSHAGGTVPMLAGRIQAGAAFFGLEKIAPDGVERELGRLYYDVANSANRPALVALTALVAGSQILFGTDYPFADVGVTVRDASTLGLSSDALQVIRRDNAVALFPRLKAIVGMS
jgi:predicted TIM-barrel fold metal-dependent hydrolase